MEKNESKYIRIMMINHPVHLSMLYKGAHCQTVDNTFHTMIFPYCIKNQNSQNDVSISLCIFFNQPLSLHSTALSLRETRLRPIDARNLNYYSIILIYYFSFFLEVVSYILLSFTPGYSTVLVSLSLFNVQNLN